MKSNKAKAVWNGSLKEGNGNITTHSVVLKNAKYDFNSRLEMVKVPTPMNYLPPHMPVALR